jgi:hypothetical protein
LESLFAHARLIGIARTRWEEVNNTFKCRYVSCHDRHAYGAEGKVDILPTPKKRLKTLVPPPLQNQSSSSTTSNVQPTIENVATTYIGHVCKTIILNDVDVNTPLTDATLHSSWGTPRVTLRNAAGVFLATPFHAGFDYIDDNCKIESLMAMLADAKSQKEVEVGQLRTRSTNERERNKAELKELTWLLSEARTSDRVPRDRHDVVTAKLDAVTLERVKAQKQVKEL